MKIFFLILFLLLFPTTAFALNCDFYQNSCPSNYVCLLSAYQENNTHVANCSYYSLKFCCQDPYLFSAKVRPGCLPGEFPLLDLYDQKNAHVSNSGNGSLVLSLSFEEGSGNKVYDSSGNSNHGKIYGASWVSGKFGKALEFDGVDDWVEILHSESLAPTQEITIIAWIRPNLDNTFNMIIGKTGSYYLYINSANELTFWIFNSSGNGIALYYQLSSEYNNRWTYVVGTYKKDGFMRLYIDSKLVREKLPPNIPDIIRYSTENVGVGNAPTLDQWFNGTIDEIRIYNKTLTEVEIKALYFQRICVSAPWQCYLRNNCLPEETPIISLYQPYNSHIGKVGYYSNLLCCKKETESPKYLNVFSNTSKIFPGQAVKLSAEWKDNGKIHYAWLSTNETGQWKNYTDGTYSSPLLIDHFWEWSNFTWQNSSVESGSVIAWRICTNDTAGNENCTSVQTFKVVSPISLEDTTGAIPLKGWGETFTFKVNVSHEEGYTVNVTLWKSTDGINWIAIDSQNCTNCLTETQLTFEGKYFTCEDLINSGGTMYYKFNATDYYGGYNETSPTSFNIEKDDVSISITSGASSEVRRYGDNFQLLQVRIYDSDYGAYVPSGVSCSIYIENKRYDNLTDSNGYCNLYFNPDCSSNYFEVGIHTWLGGTRNDSCYKDLNSSETTVTVIGQLFNELLTPPKGSTFDNGDIINISGKVLDDCCNLVDNATVDFETKLNSLTKWTVLPRGLILKLHMDEGSGVTVKDYSGNGNDGTLYDADTTNEDGDTPAKWVVGKLSYGLKFDGIDDYISIQDSSSLNPKEITIIAWLKLNASNDYQAIVDKYISSENSGYYIAITSTGSIIVRIGNGTSTYSQTSSLKITWNKWQFLAFVLDKKTGNVTIFVNQSKEYLPKFIGEIYPNSRRVDISSKYFNDFVNGTLDEIYVFNRSLREEEIKLLYKANSILAYYNATFDSSGQTGGWYDVRFNSSKQYYDPNSTICFKCFYLNPLIAMEISPKLAEGVLFTNRTGAEINQQFNVEPGRWNNATWNYNASDLTTAYWIKNTGTNPQDFCMRALTDLLCSPESELCQGYSISIINVTWNNSTSTDANTPAFETTKRMVKEPDWIKVACNVQPDQKVYLRFWLYVPSSKPSGIYNTTWSIKAIEAGSTC